ncbi:HNH endonuclease family protein, partial [Klebsiella pneumoniae]
ALKSNLLNANAYAMRLARWLLEKIENRENSATLDMSNLSIEHIMPQTSTSYWEEKAGTSGEEYTGLVNTIGNLTLVTNPDNSAAGNKDFETKKKIFEDTLHIRMNKDLYELTEWTSSDISARSEA